MEKIFRDAIGENGISQEEIRRLMHESFDAIFHFLGKENFERWIDKKALADRIKKLIIEEFTEEDKKNKPNAAGFYIKGRNRMRYNEKTSRVWVHEEYHFITDFRENFGTFINEGLTEYLSYKTNEAQSFVYEPNVRFATFLHKMMGDSLVKSYFLGVGDDFKSTFSSYISSDGNPKLDELKSFEQALNVYHRYKFSHNEEERKKADEVCKKTVFPKIIQGIQNIAVNSITKKAQNLAFYKDGKLDAEKIEQEILKTVNATLETVSDYIETEKSAEFLNEIYKRAMEGIIKNSHLLVGLNNQEEVMQKLLSYMEFRQLPDGRIGRANQFPRESFQKLLEINDDKMPFKLAEVILNREEESIIESGLSKYLMQVALILQKTNANELERDSIIDACLLKRLPGSSNPEILRNVVQSLTGIAPIMYDKKMQYEKDTIESKFVQISKDHFLEKRDNKYYVIFIDREQNQIVEQELSSETYKLGHGEWGKVGRITPAKISGFSSKAIKQVTEGDYLYHINISDGKNLKNRYQVSIGFDDSFERFFDANGKTIDTPVISGIDGLIDYIATEEMIASIDKKIEREKIEKVNEDNHFEDGLYIKTREINFDVFLQEIGAILSGIPLSNRIDVVRGYIKKVYKDVYGYNMPGIEESIGIISEYFFGEKSIDASTQIEKLENLSKDMAEKARANNVKALNGELLYFRTEDERKKYFASVETKQRRKINSQIKNFMIDIPDFIVEKIEEDEGFYDKAIERLDGIYVESSATYVRPNARRIDFVRYSEAVKKFLEGVPKDKQEKVCKQLIEQSIYAFYGGYSNGIPEDIVEKMDESRDELRDKLKESILGEKELNNEELTQLESNVVATQLEATRSVAQRYKVSSKYKKQKERIERAKDDIVEIQEMEDIPEDAKKKLVEKVVQRHNLNMEELARAALSGERAATKASIRRFMEQDDKSHGR